MIVRVSVCVCVFVRERDRERERERERGKLRQKRFYCSLPVLNRLHAKIYLYRLN